MISWLIGWIETLKIRFFEPELYRELSQPIDMNDFGEVSEPKEGN